MCKNVRRAVRWNIESPGWHPGDPTLKFLDETVSNEHPNHLFLPLWNKIVGAVIWPVRIPLTDNIEGKIR